MAPGRKQPAKKITKAFSQYRADEAKIEQWNETNNIGTFVVYRPVQGSSVNQITTKTVSDAFMSPSGHPVIHLEGKSGFVSLEHVTPTANK